MKNIIREETNPEKNLQDQDFFFWMTTMPKKKREYNSHDVFAKRYNNAMIKARILLTKIANSWLNKNDHLNRAFASTFTWFSLWAWIRFLWIENSTTKTINGWFTCFRKNMYRWNFINLSVKKQFYVLEQT